MKLRDVWLCLGALVIASGSWAESTYKDALVEKCRFYETATGRFAPVYPALAKQIVQDFGITEGICVDVGGGCGSLAMALARDTDLSVYVLDIDPWAVRLCNLLVDEAELTGRVRAVEGDAQDMPFRGNFADLVVSRGSIFFWEDQLAGLTECYRILKPGGVAYIGGGFSRVLDPKIRTPLAEWKQEAIGKHRLRGWRPLGENLVRRAREAGIQDIRTEREPISGWWLVLRKPRSAETPPSPARQ